jgi:hypothetical protein
VPNALPGCSGPLQRPAPHDRRRSPRCRPPCVPPPAL